MSYFKYAERSAESRVDWNEISKSMVDMLKEQTRLRNEKLDDAVKLQGEVTTTLSDAPMGSDTNANQRVSQFAADAQEYSLMMNKLWRSGEMSYREYMASTNNFKTNTEGYLGQAEKYAANYEKHVQRMEANENGFVQGSGVEVSELARVEDFGNFSKFSPVIDAPTGSIALVGEDGQRFASVSQLGVAVMGTYDRLDVAGLTKQAVDQLGNITRPFGGGVTVEGVLTPRDAEGNPIGELTEYEKAEDEIVGGILDTSDNAATSTLVDYSNLSYESHHLDSPDDIQAAVDDPKLVVMMPSPRNKDRFIGAVEDDVTDADFEAYLDQRNVSPEQKAALIANRKAQKDKAFDLVRNRIRTGLDLSTEIEAPTQGRAPTGDELEFAERQQNQMTAMTNWRNLGLVTTQDEANALVSRIKRDEEILGVDRRIGTLDGINLLKGGVVELVYVDDEGKETIRDVERISLDSGKGTIDLENWMSQGSQVHGVSSPGLWKNLVTDEEDRPLGVTTTGGTTIPQQRGPVERWDQGTVQTTTYNEDGRATGQASVGAEEAWQNSGLDSDGDEVNFGDRLENRAALVGDIITQRTGRGTDEIKYYPLGSLVPVFRDTDMSAANAVSFYVPGITPMPIFIPMTRDGNGEQKLKELTQLVLLASDAQGSGVLTQQQMERIISELDFPNAKKFNNVMNEEFGGQIEETIPVRERSTNPAP
jgi:hypothetical protein